MRRVFVLLFCFFVLAQYIGAGEVPNRSLDQSERLATLGKVWGLLKYFHPDVATGAIDWDAALLEAIPRVKGAVDFVSFNQELNNLIMEAGDVSKAEANPHTAAYPNEELFKWLKRDSILDEVVRKKLQLPEKNYPGVFYWDKYRYAGLRKQDYYKGKVIILVNEETVGQSEFTCMALEVAPDVTIIGSQTATISGIIPISSS